MNAGGATWRKLRRLRGMDANEVAHRAKERLRSELEWATWRLRPSEESDRSFLRRLPRGRTDFLSYLELDVAPRFYVPAQAGARRDWLDLFGTCFPGRAELLEAEAERLCAHRFEVLGHGEIDHGAAIDWHRDPVTGARWPKRFWSRYDLVAKGAPGDPKLVHEANRHQHLPRLAKAHFVLGRERYAREVVDQILGWIDQNPRGTGVHWHSSLELALRAVSWLWALLLVLPARALDEAAARRIGKSLFAQLDHVCAYPSIYSSPNTHILGEATALVLAGLLFRDCERGRVWLRRGTRWLDEAMERQVGSDGVHGELSAWYHCYALDMSLQALVLARWNQRPLSAALERRVETMLEFLAHVARPDGSLPRLGDDDGGRALALEQTDYADARDLLCCGAVTFGRGDLKGPASEYREPALWLLGPDGRRQWEALPGAMPSTLRASFHDSGYSVQRSGWTTSDSHLVFDCGGLGRLGGGHGHADALSLVLWANGHELLVDPGTFTYNGCPKWRDRFRGTGAHNTVVVDELPQSEPGGTFQWSSRAAARLVEEHGSDGIDYLAGEHDGYTRGDARVVHRRRLLYVRPDTWIIVDELTGDDVEHTFDLVYHLAPGASISTPAARATSEAAVDVTTTGGALRMFFHASSVLSLATLRGGTEGGTDWVSRRYGERLPAPVVTARFRARPPAAAISILRADPTSGSVREWSPRALPVRTTASSTAPRLAVRMRHPGYDDVVLFSADAAEIVAGPYRARAELLLARHAGQRIERLFSLRGTTFAVPTVGAPGRSGSRSFERARRERAFDAIAGTDIAGNRPSPPGETSCAG